MRLAIPLQGGNKNAQTFGLKASLYKQKVSTHDDETRIVRVKAFLVSLNLQRLAPARRTTTLPIKTSTLNWLISITWASAVGPLGLDSFLGLVIATICVLQHQRDFSRSCFLSSHEDEPNLKLPKLASSARYCRK